MTKLWPHAVCYLFPTHTKMLHFNVDIWKMKKYSSRWHVFRIEEIAMILYKGNDIISYLLDTYTQCNGQIFTFQ